MMTCVRRWCILPIEADSPSSPSRTRCRRDVRIVVFRFGFIRDGARGRGGEEEKKSALKGMILLSVCV